MTVTDPAETGRLATLGRLLPGALHELANPLLALVGTVEFLAQDAEPGSREAERLALVRGTADEIAGIVRSLQQLGRERVEPEQPIELAAFARETLELVRRLGGVRDVELGGSFDGDAAVTARPADLRQAVLTLLLDAIAAAGPGGALELGVERAELRVAPAPAESAPTLAAVAAALGAELERDAAGAVRLRFPAS